MVPDKEEIKLRIYRMNAGINGLVAGLICGFGIFLLTIILVARGGDVVGPHLSLLGQYLIGYRVTVLGSFVGFIYGFSIGYILGYLASRLYNFFTDIRNKNGKG